MFLFVICAGIHGVATSSIALPPSNELDNAVANEPSSKVNLTKNIVEARKFFGFPEESVEIFIILALGTILLMPIFVYLLCREEGQNTKVKAP